MFPRLQPLLVAALLAMALAPCEPARATPDWVAEAARAETPAHAAGAPAVVLLRHSSVKVVRDEVVSRSERVALRILTPEGRTAARRSFIYTKDSVSARWLKAWYLRPDGSAIAFTADDMPDALADPNDVFSDVRATWADASELAEPGSLFAVEWFMTERPLFGHFEWSFADGLPVANAQLELSLQPGWTASSKTFNHPEVAPRVIGATGTWELQELPWVPDEPFAPPLASRTPWIAVRFFRDPAPPDTPALGSWPEVALWLEELAAPTARVGESVKRRVSVLTEGLEDERARLEAIADQARAVKYVSIQTGVGHGGGYKPRGANLVMKSRYGDCKDQTTLVRSMAAAIGERAHALAVYSGDPGRVEPSWPSPQQFNHAIAAFEVGEDFEAPAVFTHPTLGRLLAFDPTDWSVPLGELPLSLQGSLALVAGDETGQLVRLAASTPELNRVERDIEARLSSDGSLELSIDERTTGSEASARRRELRWLTEEEGRLLARHRFSAGPAGIEIQEKQHEDSGGALRSRLRARAAHHASSPDGRLSVLSTFPIAGQDPIDLECSTRSQPIRLSPRSLQETVRIRLPPDQVVEDLPTAVDRQEGWGSLVASWEQEGEILTASRTWSLHGSDVDASSCSVVQEFLDEATTVGRAVAVLGSR